MLKFGLAGNPNSGKTTLFNVLTGSNQYVGNWPGVTVEKKEGKINKNNILVDLPGIYSLSPYSMEEIITRDFLLKENVDVIINIVDATNIERNLYLTTQLMETNIPIVIALNMMDLVEKRQDKIDIKKMELELGCPIVPISALKGKGLKEIVEKANEIAGKKLEYNKIYSMEIGLTIEKIQDIANCSFFDAVKLFEKDNIISKYYDSDKLVKINKIIENIEKKQNDDAESIITNERYNYVSRIVNRSVKKKRELHSLSTSDKIDMIVTNRWLALPIFALVMFIVYYVSISTIGDLTITLVESIFFFIAETLKEALININADEWLISLVIDGIIGGVGSVLSFVPQLMILFLFLALLEDSGYMSRVAFIMDRLFKKFGLSGKSFIPMLIGTGCSVPAIMASRTIENEKDRRMTIMLTPFIPCGAKLPVFALLVGAFFSPIAATSVYFLGIATVVISGIILKKTKYFRGSTSNFIMELPEYRIPSIKNVYHNVWDRTRSFIIKAGTIIFVASALVWFLSSFSFQLQMVSDASESILASLGRTFAWIFKPLGFGSWEATVALISGMIAKENIISTLGIVLKVGSDMSESSLQLKEAIRILFNNNGIAAYAFMSFILLAAPCFAAIATTKKEMGSRKLMWITVSFQTFVAYLVSFLIYQIGTLWVKSDNFKTYVIFALIIFLIFMATLYIVKKRKNACITCSICSKENSCDKK